MSPIVYNEVPNFGKTALPRTYAFIVDEAGAEEHISRDPREAVDVERLAHDGGVPFSR